MTYPTPRLHPDHAADPVPDTRGDWSLYGWVPVVFAAAALRWVRIRVGVALIDLGARIMPDVLP